MKLQCASFPSHYKKNYNYLETAVLTLVCYLQSSEHWQVTGGGSFSLLVATSLQASRVTSENVKFKENAFLLLLVVHATVVIVVKGEER